MVTNIKRTAFDMILYYSIQKYRKLFVDSKHKFLVLHKKESLRAI